MRVGPLSFVLVPGWVSYVRRFLTTFVIRDRKGPFAFWGLSITKMSDNITSAVTWLTFKWQIDKWWSHRPVVGAMPFLRKSLFFNKTGRKQVTYNKIVSASVLSFYLCPQLPITYFSYFSSLPLDYLSHFTAAPTRLLEGWVILFALL